jgi:hypothetical protein
MAIEDTLGHWTVLEEHGRLSITDKTAGSFSFVAPLLAALLSAAFMIAKVQHPVDKYGRPDDSILGLEVPIMICAAVYFLYASVDALVFRKSPLIFDRSKNMFFRGTAGVCRISNIEHICLDPGANATPRNSTTVFVVSIKLTSKGIPLNSSTYRKEGSFTFSSQDDAVRFANRLASFLGIEVVAPCQ